MLGRASVRPHVLPAFRPKITVLAGGTGTGTTLPGLLALTPARSLSVIVPAWDSGGSSGRLARSNRMVPPGDARQALTALAGKGGPAAGLLRHRFGTEHEPGLTGHAVGNLLLAALTEMYEGDFVRALSALGKMLRIAGNVFPAAAAPLVLQAETGDGRVIVGESRIAQSAGRIRRVLLRPGHAPATPGALAAIAGADVIVLGPGSLYTSVIPHLLVDGVADAIARSPAVRIYVCNVAAQPGETGGMSAADHLRALCDHAPGRCLVDYAVVHVGHGSPDWCPGGQRRSRGSGGRPRVLHAGCGGCVRARGDPPGTMRSGSPQSSPGFSPHPPAAGHSNGSWRLLRGVLRGRPHQTRRRRRGQGGRLSALVSVAAPAGCPPSLRRRLSGHRLRLRDKRDEDVSPGPLPQGGGEVGLLQDRPVGQPEALRQTRSAGLVRDQCREPVAPRRGGREDQDAGVPVAGGRLESVSGEQGPVSLELFPPPGGPALGPPVRLHQPDQDGVLSAWLPAHAVDEPGVRRRVAGAGGLPQADRRVLPIRPPLRKAAAARSSQTRTSRTNSSWARNRPFRGP